MSRPHAERVLGQAGLTDTRPVGTYGALTATDLTEAELAALLVKMRTDLEQSK